MLHNKKFGVQLLVDGRALAECLHADGFSYVLGKKGTVYVFRLINRSQRRVVFVPSIDGLSISGLSASSLSNNLDPGYIVDAGTHVDIPGLRLGDTELVPFTFGGPAGPLASKLRVPPHPGVIQCAVFGEELDRATDVPVLVPQPQICDSDPRVPGGPDSLPEFMGPAADFHKMVTHHPAEDHFVRSARAECTFHFRYGDVRHLRSVGISVRELSGMCTLTSVGEGDRPKCWRGMRQ